MVQINFTNRWLYTFIVFGIIIVLSVGVYAYQSGFNDPSVMGHSFEELGLETVSNHCSLSSGNTIYKCTAQCPTGKSAIASSCIITDVGDGFNMFLNYRDGSINPPVWSGWSCVYSSETPLSANNREIITEVICIG